MGEGESTGKRRKGCMRMAHGVCCLQCQTVSGSYLNVDR